MQTDARQSEQMSCSCRLSSLGRRFRYRRLEMLLGRVSGIRLSWHVVRLGAVAGIAVLLFGCAVSELGTTQREGNGEADARAGPIRVCVQQDKTGSAAPNLVPQLGFDDFEPILDLLKNSGGEVAFGILNVASDHPLARLRVEPPAVEPAGPAPTGNSFKDAQLQRQYDEVDHPTWEETYRAWERETNKRIQQFGDKITPLLAEQPGGSTDVYGALRRCDLFLSESDSSWPQPPTKYLVLITDGEETVNGLPVAALASQPTVLVINATAALGVLESLKPIRFESAGAAFKFIETTEAGR